MPTFVFVEIHYLISYHKAIGLNLKMNLSIRKFLVLATILFVIFMGIGILIRKTVVNADLNSNGSRPTSFEFDFLPNCQSNCPNGVNIKCRSESQVETLCGSNAPACAGNCEITMPDFVCQSMGITDNLESQDVRLSHEELQSILSTPNPNFAGQCSLVHEYGHICDPEVSSSQACDETYAQNLEYSCIKQRLDYNCLGENPPWDAEKCRRGCEAWNDDSIPVKIWDACICNNSSGYQGVDGGTCCNCLNECKNLDRVQNLIPQTCRAFGYTGPTQQELNEICSRHSKEGGHNCDYHNEQSEISTGDGGIVSGKCEAGTGFNPEGCNAKLSVCLEPNTISDEDEFANVLSVRHCEVIGENFVPYFFSWSIGPKTTDHCSSPQTDECLMDVSCIKFSCNLGTTSSGSVRVRSGSENLSGVTVKAQKDKGPYSLGDNAVQEKGTTDDQGDLKINLTLGSWKITAEKQGYPSQVETLVVTKGQTFTLNFQFSPAVFATPSTTATSTVSASTTSTIGTIVNSTGNQKLKVTVLDNRAKINGARVTISQGSSTYTKSTNLFGVANFTKLVPGKWNIIVQKDGYHMLDQTPASETLPGDSKLTVQLRRD